MEVDVGVDVYDGALWISSIICCICRIRLDTNVSRLSMGDQSQSTTTGSRR